MSNEFGQMVYLECLGTFRNETTGQNGGWGGLLARGEDWDWPEQKLGGKGTMHLPIPPLAAPIQTLIPAPVPPHCCHILALMKWEE